MGEPGWGLRRQAPASILARLMVGKATHSAGPSHAAPFGPAGGPGAAGAQQDPSSVWRVADRVLREAERAITLLTRCRPRNASAALANAISAWKAGQPTEPPFEYRPAPDLASTRRHLAELMERLPADVLSGLYVARAMELDLECRMAEAVGTQELPRLAAQRYWIGDTRTTERATQLALGWAELQVESTAPLTLSGDTTLPDSLYNSLGRAIGEQKLPFVVRLSDELTASAATGDGVIWVAPDRLLSDNDVRRIVAHEVLGHALPRVRARQRQLGFFATGSARGDDEQEGYALLLEQELGLMDSRRQRELGLRHLAATRLRAGASWVDTVRSLVDHGAPLELAANVAARAHRGGGLGREIVYLPAWLRVGAALEHEPGLRDVLGSGRLSLEAARLLRSLGEACHSS